MMLRFSHLSAIYAYVLMLSPWVYMRETLALDNGAALTPPMGWSTWNKLKCKFNADVLLSEADHMVQSGMLAAGYTTLNIDDCWSEKKGRNAAGEIVPDPNKFPFGMKNFSGELAKRGVGLGTISLYLLSPPKRINVIIITIIVVCYDIGKQHRRSR